MVQVNVRPPTPSEPAKGAAAPSQPADTGWTMDPNGGWIPPAKPEPVDVSKTDPVPPSTHFEKVTQPGHSGVTHSPQGHHPAAHRPHHHALRHGHSVAPSHKKPDMAAGQGPNGAVPPRSADAPERTSRYDQDPSNTRQGAAPLDRTTRQDQNPGDTKPPVAAPKQQWWKSSGIPKPFQGMDISGH